jgi:hypothetical protein
MPRWAWMLGAAALFAWQGWLTLGLFGDDPVVNLLNDQPIATGVHPQNLYLGYRRVRGIMADGRATVLDVSFQALYPNTPIFDGGRVAELFLLLGGGTYQPAAYKIGFAALCLAVPFFLLLAGQALGLGNFTTLLATFIGQLAWWGPHGRTAIATSDCELYLASLAALAHVGLLIAFHRSASARGWLGLWLTAAIGWFLQPLLFPLALPVLLAYYLSVGTKHEFLTWHFALWFAEILAVVVNLPWLIDWFDSWWLRAALPTAPGLLEHRTLGTIWNAPIWGGATDRLLAVVLMASAALGVIILNQTQQRPAARLLGMGAGGSLVLALLGISWEPLGAVGTASLYAPALWFACLPAVHAWTWTTGRLWKRGRVGRALLGMVVAAVAACFVVHYDASRELCARCGHIESLEIGLGLEREAIARTLVEYTNTDARILWEDRSCSRQSSRWSALLPLMTKRSYVGGLDPDGFIEHSAISLMNQSLDRQPIAAWSDEELAEYCRRYNIRWIVAWTPEVIQRFEEWPAASKLKALEDDGAGWLFQIDRTPSFALKGKADLLYADGHSIMLGNVVPHNGEVIVSLHYQAGMRASLDRVRVERADPGDDIIGFVRLRLNTEATCVILTWDR